MHSWVFTKGLKKNIIELCVVQINLPSSVSRLHARIYADKDDIQPRFEIVREPPSTQLLLRDSVESTLALGGATAFVARGLWGLLDFEVLQRKKINV